MTAVPAPTPDPDAGKDQQPDRDTVKGPPQSPTELLQLIAEATANFRAAEAIIQQRLYNFLMAESILLLASVAVVASEPTPGRRLLVLAVSIPGVALALGFMILGFREKLFVKLHDEIIRRLERRLDDELWRVNEPISDLRDGKKVKFPITGLDAQLTRPERTLRSTNLAALVPAVFIVAFVALLGVFLTGWS